ncbi:MAG: helix-turn-helix domain-containing protein [Pseudomonadota bacterium]
MSVEAELNSNHPDSLVWSLAGAQGASRSEVWAQALSNSFFPWTLEEHVGADFTAELRQRDYDGFRLSRCACGPTSGVRTRSEIAETSSDFYSILYVVKGQETVIIDGREIHLHPGAILLWDGERPMRFKVRSDLEKLTLVAPATELESIFPFARDRVGSTVDSTKGPGALFANHLLTLESVGWRMDPADLNRAMRGTLELFAQAFAAEREGPSTTHKRLTLERIRRYCLQNLADPAMTPSSVALAHGISTRYLHALFSDTGETIGNWLKRERLKRCRAALETPSERGRTITEIAFSWGFQDMSHFSKVFKAEYGVTPREIRSGIEAG